MKKNFKKIIMHLIICLLLTLMLPSQISAAPKLNKSKATLYVGETLQLKLKGASKKISWKSNKTSVASVNSKGKVTAKKGGKATITAIYGKTKISCVVTVKYAECGDGSMYISTPSGNSKNNKVPTLSISKDTVLCQIGFYVSDFNSKYTTFIYVDGKQNFKWKVSDGSSSITLTGSLLKKGTHTVEVFQYQKNKPSSKVVTYKKAKFKIKYS